MNIFKARSGIYQDNSKNRRLHRVGQRYGENASHEEKNENNQKDDAIYEEFNKFKKENGLIDVFQVVIDKYPVLKKLGSDPSNFTENKVKELGVDWHEARSLVSKVYDINRKISENLKKEKDDKIVNNGGSANEILLLFSRNPEKAVQALKHCSKNVLKEILEQIQTRIDILKDLDSAASLKEAAGYSEFGDKVIAEVYSRMRKEEEEEKRQQKENIRKEEEEEMKVSNEKFTRIHLDEVPQSGKINLKKYLSNKRKKVVDEEVQSMSRMDLKSVKQVLESATDSLNQNFDTYSKAERAEQLYRILRLKAIVENLEKTSDDKIGKLLGIKKGKPMTHEEADAMRANPNFSRDSKDYCYNCQCCVLAYEMRRRGYDVQASAWNSKENSVQYFLAIDPARAFVYNKTANGNPIPMDSEIILPMGATYLKKRYNSVPWGMYKKSLETSTKENGRYLFSFVFHKKNGRREGHVIIVEKSDSGLTFFDPQIGRSVDLESYSTFIDRRFFRIKRVDNLEINPDVIVRKPVISTK